MKMTIMVGLGYEHWSQLDKVKSNGVSLLYFIVG